MNKKELSIQDIELLNTKNDELRGTSNYSKYHMECYAKTNSKWNFCSWSIPSKTTLPLKIKKVKNNYYILQGDYRYTVTTEVDDLLNVYSEPKTSTELIIPFTNGYNLRHSTDEELAEILATARSNGCHGCLVETTRYHSCMPKAQKSDITIHMACKETIRDWLRSSYIPKEIRDGNS